jgi:hypothetical protein
MEENNKSEYVRSLSEFLDTLFAKIEKISKNNVVWFRGENSDNYQLVPNIYRRFIKGNLAYCKDKINTKDFSILEQNIDTSFYRKSSIFLSAKGVENTPWNRYFLKQHYGVITRLLDWTENALYALFFALQNKTNANCNARVWILSPFALNNYSISKLHSNENTFYKILTLSDFKEKQDLINDKGEFSIKELGRIYYRMDCEEGQMLYPLAIYPPHLDQRMVAQQSCFTLFGNTVNGLINNDSSETFLEKIDIDAHSKQNILNELKRIGISSYSVFPDLDGLGKSINEDSAYDIEHTQNNSDLHAFFNQTDF